MLGLGPEGLAIADVIKTAQNPLKRKWSIPNRIEEELET